ncbi:MAG TPA: SpoIIE family protein phosphatase [Candidatus Binatia bacterium]|nr:SpoIIE family protein phosphatase [Candidatus Binatia bacterium]
MATVGDSYFEQQLTARRERLAAVAAHNGVHEEVARLVAEVDAALDRLHNGTYGICEQCHEPIEAEGLVVDPLRRICLEHLTPGEARGLEADLEMAARIQRALLPPQNLSVHGWEVHYHYEPLGLVSGDFCDLIVAAPPAGELFFLLGDVSGKGVAASLLMSNLHAMFRSLATVEQPLDQMMALANRLFCQSTISGQFATLVAGRADRQGRMEVVSAGHPPMLLLGSSGVRRIDSSGLPLGMFRETQFPAQSLELHAGETLLFYSDGVTEARNPAGEEFGVERLAQFSSRHRGHSAEKLVGSCLGELRAFSAGQPRGDDLTLMVLRRAA